MGSLKDWTIALVMDPTGEFTPHALWALWLLAFAESSFFPIPPDIPYILMGIAKPSVSLYLALILTVGSVLGGAVGYFIGLYGGRPLVEWLISTRFIGRLFSHEKFEMVESYYNRYDVWAVLIAAFTPIPFKIFTIGGGLCRIRFWRFMAVAAIGRAGRFFLVGAFLFFLGERAQFILRHFDKFLILMLVLVVLGFAAMRFLKPAKTT
ncbi:MAG: DedA family protein [Candidatus Omnitrophota bacterium]|nr:MAG: DedA family protein [Candidatus Omnitrophota bacterium]